MKYGFIGLGNLGGHLAASLLREGFSVCVTDIDPKLGDRHVAMGGVFLGTPQDVAAQSDAVFTCLPSPAVSEMVLHKMLETAKAAFTKQLVVDVNAKAITPQFVQFIDKNIKANPGKSTLKFNISDPLQNMKIGLYTLEKGFMMNDDMVAFIEENVELEVSVVCL